VSVSTVVVYDTTGGDFAHLPAGDAAGYVTGAAGVPWSAEQFAERPGSVHIDQTPVAGVWDATADVDDYENGAVQLNELAPRARARMAAFSGGLRPGQRKPAVYCSRANVTSVVNALIAGGITSGVGLWIADWSGTEAEAAAEVAAGSGPFPEIGRQYVSNGTYDTSVFSQAWLGDVSVAAAAVVKPALPPGQWDDPRAWTWRDAMIVGQGLNGAMYAFLYNPATGAWGPVTLP
jgi:hypothetical protein